VDVERSSKEEILRAAVPLILFPIDLPFSRFASRVKNEGLSFGDRDLSGQSDPFLLTFSLVLPHVFLTVLQVFLLARPFRSCRE